MKVSKIFTVEKRKKIKSLRKNHQKLEKMLFLCISRANDSKNKDLPTVVMVDLKTTAKVVCRKVKTTM